MGQSLASVLLCLVLGLSLSLAQDMPTVGDPMFDVTYDVMMIRRYMATARINGRIQLDCQVSPPGRFRAWVKNSMVIGTEPTLQKPVDDPNVFGIYYCIADPPTAPKVYRALQFVITDMPPDSETTEVSVQANQNVALTCKLTASNGAYKWYKYDDSAFQFNEISGETGKQLSLSYSTLNREHGSGFTYYKCVVPSNPSVYHAFKTEKDPVREMIDGRMTNVYEQSMRALPTDVATVPISVTPKSKVTFECHKVGPSDETKWYFRDNTTMSPSRYDEMREGSGGVEIQNNPDSSVLSLKDCDVKNKGYYRCNVGGVVKYAFLDIRVIVPTIHDYGKGIYDLAKNPGADNELECEIPIGGEVKDVVWRIVPADGSAPFDIPVNRNANGFETSIKDSASNQLVTVKFRDNPSLNNYRLECRLGDELDYVTLQSDTPFEISISVTDSKFPGYRTLVCTFDERMRNIRFHISDTLADPPGQPLTAHTKQNDTTALYYSKPTANNHWYRCSGQNLKGDTIYSDPVPLIKDPLMLDIKIDGAVTPKGLEPKIAKVQGQRTEFVCNFTNYKNIDLRPGNIKLALEGRILPDVPVQVSPGAYKFVFENPQPGMSGKYFCIHNVDTAGQNVRSTPVTINWCATDQFMCDGRCRSKSIICDGARDCADGSDEFPALCSPCEPNEVPCNTWKGAMPARSCVLKHWLCDGTDDCENGYDEESPIAKEWCTNTCTNKPWLNCPGNSTCCSSQDKCIPRAYECDSEVDCSRSEDENVCCSLTLTAPATRQVVEQSAGAQVTLTCIARGSERPTISWRCNWGKLRDETRMKESNRVLTINADNTYEVQGTLVIENFTTADECIYNCEAVTKCKRQMSPEFDVKVKP